LLQIGKDHRRAVRLSGEGLRRRTLTGKRSREDVSMTLCPVALAVGCEKCPIVKVCPAKTLIGDYEKEESEESS
jgi:hypothetical protein